MKNKKSIVIVYTFCLYTMYLYVEEFLSSFNYKIKLPLLPFIKYLDISLLFFGGILFGIILLRFGGIFNKILGVFMILANTITIALLLPRALV